jgi:YVTN family beta-propeller protein
VRPKSAIIHPPSSVYGPHDALFIGLSYHSSNFEINALFIALLDALIVRAENRCISYSILSLAASGITGVPAHLVVDPLRPSSPANPSGSTTRKGIYQMSPNKISNKLPGFLPYLYASYEVGARFGKVAVIDPEDDSVIAHIPVGANPGAMATTPMGNKIYVANTGESSVSVINTETNRVTTTLPVGRNTSAQEPAAPTAIIYHPNGQKVYVANSNNHTVTVIDAVQDKVLIHLPMGVGQPFAFAVSENSPFVFVACKYKDNRDYVIAISIDNESFYPFGMEAELTFDPLHNPLAIHPNGSTVVVLGTNGYMKYFHESPLDGESNTSYLDNTVSGIYAGSSPAKLFTTSPVNKSYLKLFEDLIIKPDGVIPPPVTFRDISSYKGQDQIRVSLNPKYVCITVQATAQNPAGLQIYNLQGTESRFVELYYAGDLTITSESYKAYVEQRSVIVPIDLDTATAGEPIEISPSSSQQTIILKDILASYEMQNAGPVSMA